MTRCSTVSTAVDPELVARFKSALERLNPEGGRIGLAVSGGPDSMAMLLLAHEAIPGGFEVASVDHGLRPEAREECALVERACAERGVACAVLCVTVQEGNVQAMAREARYGALGDWAEAHGLNQVATAHHADDQAETLALRLNRASGLAGLAGVREHVSLFQHDLEVIRPVLGFRRAELAGVVAGCGLETAQDPSNTDDSYDRVRIRRAIAEATWIDQLAWARSASYLAESEEVLATLTETAWQERKVLDDGGLFVARHRFAAVRRRLLERGIRKWGIAPRGADLERLLMRLERGGRGNLAGVDVRYSARVGDGAGWDFRPEPPRRTS